MWILNGTLVIHIFVFVNIQGFGLYILIRAIARTEEITVNHD